MVNENELSVLESELQILNEDKTDFNEQTILIFKEVFDSFALEGKMSRDMMARFTQRATDGINNGQYDDRVVQVFRDFANGGEFMNFEQFLNFYRHCVLVSKKIDIVQSNLIYLGYNSTLRLKNFQGSA